MDHGRMRPWTATVVFGGTAAALTKWASLREPHPTNVTPAPHCMRTRTLLACIDACDSAL
eukprot:4196877-Pyramimonas_sp.AAC.1